MVERDDHKLDDFIMDVLGTDISGIPMFLLTKYITHARKDMKAHMCAQTGECTHTLHTLHTLHLGADSIDGSPGHHTDASVSVPLTLHTHNFK